MKKLILIFACLHCSLSFSQSFQIDIQPERDTLFQGDTISFAITATTSGGFNASIYLSTTVSSCLSSINTLLPTALNAPYSNGQLNITNTSSLIPGDYIIIVKGENPPLESYDTCYLNVQPASPLSWVIYDTQNSGMTYNSVWDIQVDSLNKYWLAINFQSNYGVPPGCLAHYDGINWEIWTSAQNHFITNNCGDVIFQDSSSRIPGDGSVTKIHIDKNGVKWLSTGNGLVRFDGTNWQLFNTSNSGLPSNHIFYVTVDSLDNKWIGTLAGLVKFDNTNWTVYNTGNSLLPHDWVRSIAVESNNQIWLGTQNGFCKFDGTFWTTYNTANSGLPDNTIHDIKIDNSGTKWMATDLGIAKFTGTNWNAFLPSSLNSWETSSYCINIDSDENVWAGFGSGGIGKFNGTSWEIYNSSNSALPLNAYGNPEDVVYAVNFDHNDNVLIGVWGGGFVKVNPLSFAVSVDSPKKNSFLELNIFPNPSHKELNIQGIVKKTQIRLFDALGKLLIQKYVDGDVTFDLENFEDGIYYLQANMDGIISSKKLMIVK